MKQFLAVILQFICFISCVENGSTEIYQLLLVSLDGFRYDYLKKYDAPNLKKLADEGVSTPEGMIPSFPTVTLCNHQTLVTGLYPESHGIIFNHIYDPVYNEYFIGYEGDSKWWNEAEPIWITATNLGLKTGVSFWPGATITHDKTRANFIEVFEFKQNFFKRVDTAIDWLKNKNLDFVAVYFEQPDGEGHMYGPDSDQVASMVKYVDTVIGELVTGLKYAEIFDKINIIITSDHGMTNINKTEENALVITKHLDRGDYEKIPQLGAIAGILPRKGMDEIVFKKLNNKHPHVKVYYKKDIPERLHYQNNRKIMPIVVIADEHYFVSYNGSDFNNTATSGMHGYDNNVTSMRALLLATGPSFQKNVQLEPFNNIDVYSLMCHLLKIKPKPSNGTLTAFESVLSTNNIKHPSFCVIAISILFMFVN